MVRCSFCKEEIKPGTGTIYSTIRGDVYQFCSKKCERNQLKLKRAPRKTKWVAKKKKVKE